MLCVAARNSHPERPIISLAGFRKFTRAIDPVEMLMTLLKRCCVFFAATLLLFALGCASTSAREGAGETVDDTVITTRVRAVIFNEPSLKAFQINVETYRNVVQLSGFVGTGANMDKAVHLAGAVKGVSAVRNDMRLR